MIESSSRGGAAAEVGGGESPQTQSFNASQVHDPSQALDAVQQRVSLADGIIVPVVWCVAR
jgi:hypothetical protein